MRKVLIEKIGETTIVRTWEELSPDVKNNYAYNKGADYSLNSKKNTLNIEDVSKTMKLRIKVVYGDKGYTQLPKYSQYISVEPMTATKRQITKLSIDKFEPLPVDDEKTVDPKVDPLKSAALTEGMPSFSTQETVSVDFSVDPLKGSDDMPF